MSALVLLCLIVAASPAASTGEGDAGGVADGTRSVPATVGADGAGGLTAAVDEVFQTDFGESADCDYDGWPDHWTRRSGPGFPMFNKIAISEESPPGGGRSLRIDIDGGGAVAYSPPLSFSPLCDYLLEAHVRTEGLVHDRVFVSLGVLDEHGKTLQTFCSERVRGSPRWSQLRLGPVSPNAPRSKSVILGLHVEPTAKSDLKGCAMFGRLRLGRLPRMTLVADAPAQIYTHPKRPVVSCTVSGLREPDAKAALELTDLEGRVLMRASMPLKTPESPEVSENSDVYDPKKTQESSKEPRVFAGSIQWSPPLPGPGFYRVRATVERRPSDLLRREIGLAVVGPQSVPLRNEFGWSLPHGEGRVTLEALGQVVTQAGLGWVKYPLWLESSRTEAQFERLFAFLQHVSSRGVVVIGVLGRAPEEIRGRFDPARAPSAAEVFAGNSEIWRPSVERTLALTGTQVRWWQLGQDDDTSFAGYPGLEVKAALVKRELDRMGYGLQMGMCWDWQHPLPSARAGNAPWSFVSLAVEPPLTAAELGARLAAMQREGRPRLDVERDQRSRPVAQRDQLDRWVLLKPLSRRACGPEDRAKDLIERILSAKQHGVRGIFVSDPLDREHGLLDDDGVPGELFLTWRTAALALGGAEPLESVSLPGGSTSHVFVRGHDAVMVARNRTPTQETLFLGEDVRHVDPWGRPQQVVKTEAGHQFRLASLPSFLTGLNKSVALWRHRFVLAVDRTASVFNQRQRNGLEFQNTFGGPVEGRVTLLPPEQWTVQPDRLTFRLKPGETLRRDFDLTLPNNAVSGRHTLRADFVLEGDSETVSAQGIRFSAYRSLWIGLAAVRLEFATRLNERGELEIQQSTVMESDKPIRLRCQLFAPNRQTLSTQVEGSGGHCDLKIYRFPEGRDLIGKTLWLQAQDLRGTEVLNYRFTAKP